jgi:hypothetical protein
MVDQILRQAEGGGSWACPEMGVNLVGFGLGAGLLNLAYQFSSGTHGAPLALVVAGAALLVASLVYMVVWTATARRAAERVSLRAVHAGRVMGAVWCSVTVAAFCQPHIFNQWSASAIWTLGGAISMLVNGFLGERRALAGGLILLASLVVANYVPAISGYALAAGFLFGYVAVGVMYLTGIGSAHGRG